MQACNGLEAVSAVSRVAVMNRQSSSDVDDEASKKSSDKSDSSAAAMPVAILMDSNMPLINGPDATEQIRKLVRPPGWAVYTNIQSRQPSLPTQGYKYPIFGVTGDEDIETFIRAGADGVMLKPVKCNEMLDRFEATVCAGGTSLS